MENFFQKMDVMFKEYLDYPIPALLLQENKKKLNEYLLNNSEFNHLDFLKNFLLAQGYEIVLVEGFKINTIYEKSEPPRSMAFYLCNNVESITSDGDYIVIIKPEEKIMEFIGKNGKTKTINI